MLEVTGYSQGLPIGIPPGLAPPGLQTPLLLKDLAASQVSDDLTHVRDDASRVSYATNTNTSVMSADVSFLQSMGECKFLEDDLETFCATLKSRMTSALCALQPVDEELFVATGQVPLMIKELMSEAKALATDLTLASHNEMLVLASCTFGDSSLQELRSEAITTLSQMRKRTRRLRADYMFIMERLRYLAKVTEAVWAESVEMVMPKLNSDLLALGLLHLNKSIAHMEECSDFWIMLHQTELQLPDQDAVKAHTKEGKRKK